MGGPDMEIVRKLRGFFAAVPGVHLALLFGSRARGTARPDADLDVAVSGDGVDRLTLMSDLAAATGLNVDVVMLSDAGHVLTKALLRDAVVVHEGVPHAAVAWRTAAILITETDGPNFDRMQQAFLRRTATGSLG